MIRNKSQSELVCQEIYALIFSLPWLIAFSIMLSKTNDLVCTGDMWNNSNTALWLFVSSTIIQSVNCIIRMMEPCCGENRNAKSIINCVIFIFRLAQAALGLTIFIKICLAYGSRETCPDLQSLLLAYIIIFSISIGLGCCMVCCTSVLGIVMATKLSNATPANERALEAEIQNMVRNLEANYNQQRSPDLGQPPVELVVVSSPKENGNLIHQNENFDSIERVNVKIEMPVDISINNNYNNEDHNKDEIINNELSKS